MYYFHKIDLKALPKILLQLSLNSVKNLNRVLLNCILIVVMSENYYNNSVI